MRFILNARLVVKVDMLSVQKQQRSIVVRCMCKRCRQMLQDDSEDNHVLVRDVLDAFSVIPARYVHVPIWRTHGKYRKEMKRGYSKIMYHQRKKNETISVINRLFGEQITSMLVRTQNRVIVQKYCL
jgi:Zn-finger nucleic acid-binding protein